jgi:hypothetical protein
METSTSYTYIKPINNVCLFVGNLKERKNEAIPEELGKMEYIQL